MENKEEIKSCQNCKKDFTIEPDDFNFYEKIEVPPPTFCPECRRQRRYSWRNERTLYRRNCDLCKKSIIALYSPEGPNKVYCLTCWWGDSWNAKEFSQDFDFSRPFFEQFRELQIKVPRMALVVKNSPNCEYTNHASNSKNCYLTFALFNSEDVLYSNRILNSKMICDCSYLVTKNNEFLYECINTDSCYNSQYCFLTTNCMDCFYSYDLRNCSHCFMCSNLRNKQYCINNIQYSKDEYNDFIKNVDLASFKNRDLFNKEYKEMLSSKSIYKSTINEKSVGCSGNFIFQSNNSHYVFNADKNENVKYSIDVSENVKDCMDIYNAGVNLELCYEVHGAVSSSNALFVHMSYDNSFITYCDSVHNSQNLFGCNGLKKDNYCIFNKQYTKEEYLELKEKIIEHMKKTGEYGEFPPSSISPVSYNETQGQVYMPLTKEEALSKGFKWQDNIPVTKGKETMNPDEIPDSILDIKDNITKEILKCTSCERNYNIVFQEIEFYRRLIIPIPRKCPNCRYLERVINRPPRKLWHRSCMHKGCTNEFDTSYAPNRPEIVYCEKCYQQEVI
ncbi:MAG: hypothetical protein WCW54_02775 [Candidatus Paceibacterota bacterium]